MENKIIFLVFIILWIFHLISSYFLSKKRQLSIGKIIISHLAPSLVAIIMIYIFLICKGTSIVQFTGDSKSQMNLWSLWVSLWIPLGSATIISVLLNFTWTLIASVKKQWEWLPVSIFATIISVFSFLAVALNFPSA